MSILRLKIPDSLTREIYFASVLGLCLLAVSLGIQVMLAGMLALTPLARAVDPSTLTMQGRTWFKPEFDTPLYVFGCAVAASVAVGLVVVWNRCLTGAARAVNHERAYAGAIASTGGAFTTLLIFLAMFLFIRPHANEQAAVSTGAIGLLLVPILITVAVMVLVVMVTPFPLIAWVRQKGLAANVGSQDEGRRTVPLPARARTGWLWLVLDCLIAGGIFALVYIPGWKNVAGANSRSDGFFHWDFFAMAPAIAFRHGAALGTDFVSWYGVGWGLFFSAISPWFSLGYGHMVFVAILTGCLYFIGCFVFLRLLLGNVVWAVAGTLMAILLQLFFGLGDTTVLWFYASSTIMRYAMDIWVWIALLAHFRTRHPAWLLFAAVLAGIGLLLQTDSGISLVAGFVVYWVVYFVLFGTERTRRAGSVAGLIGSLAIILGIWAAGLLLASRGTMFTASFWTGFLTSLTTYGQGNSLLPLASYPDGWSIFLFVGMIGLYLAVFEMMVAKVIHRSPTAIDVMLGCMAFYGICILLLFVGRSHPWNLYHPSVPFSLMSVSVVARLWEFLKTQAPTRDWTAKRNQPLYWGYRAIPFLFVGAVLVAMVSNPAFRNYPSLLHPWSVGIRSTSLCLFSDQGDVCGLPPNQAGAVEQFNAVVKRMRAFAANGDSVLVLDDVDTRYYVAADIRPWGRMSPTFPNIFTQKQLEQFQNEIIAKPPTIVLIRATDAQARVRDEYDVYDALKQTLAEHMTQTGQVGEFEIWHVR